MKMLKRLGLAAALALGMTGAAVAGRHTGAISEMAALAGQELPALGMNQLDVYAAQRDAVFRLADERLAATDGHGRALLGYARQSYRTTTWNGLLPLGAASADEAHPMHVGTHVTLALTAGLLDHLVQVLPADPAVQALHATVQRELLLAGGAELCATAALPVVIGTVVPGPDAAVLVRYYTAQPAVALPLSALLMAGGVMLWLPLLPQLARGGRGRNARVATA